MIKAMKGDGGLSRPHSQDPSRCPFSQFLVLQDFWRRATWKYGSSGGLEWGLYIFFPGYSPSSGKRLLLIQTQLRSYPPGLRKRQWDYIVGSLLEAYEGDNDFLHGESLWVSREFCHFCSSSPNGEPWQAGNRFFFFGIFRIPLWWFPW